MASEEWRKKGNEEFKRGNYTDAAISYDRAIKEDSGSYLALSNRSLTYCKLQKYDLAVADADKCIAINPKWAKGYLRKAVALNFLKKYEDAQKIAVVGFNNSDVDSISSDLVKEWVEAGKALMAMKHSELLGKLAEAIPDHAVMFCDAYCDIMFTVVIKRLSDANSMSHDEMIDAIQGAVGIAEEVMKIFSQPPPVAFGEFGKAASVQIDLYPSSERPRIKHELEDKAAHLVKWLDEYVHPSLLQLAQPIVLLSLSAILVRCNALCQMYTAHNMGEYLGSGCAALFNGKAFSDPSYSALNLAVLNILLTVYRTKGEVPSDKDVELIRSTCHKMDFLLQKLPTNYPNYDLIRPHYEQSVKVAREICAKVLSGFSMSHDTHNALSELELAFLETNSNPGKAGDVALKYLQDIAQKVSLSESSSISHVNFIDAENMLYLTGIFVRLGDIESAQKVFNNGENMLLSLLATVVKKNTITLDELPATITNGRNLILSGALALREAAPTIAADALIRWKSFFTEFRALLVQLGLCDAYKQAFQSLEKCARLHEIAPKMEVFKEFKVKERKILDSAILPLVNALYHQSATAVANALDETDIALDYSFFMYNPEYHNPPKHQAYGLAIAPSQEPMLFLLDNNRAHDLVSQLARVIASLWSAGLDAMLTHPVLCELSDLLFPPAIRNIIFKRGTKRLFISPGVDLVCFPIDLLPLTNDKGITKPLFEHLSISFLSSPRELLRQESISALRKELDKVGAAANQAEDVSGKMESMGLEQKQYDCFVVANPDFDHHLTEKHEPSTTSSFQWLFSSLDYFFGHSNEMNDEETILPLPKSEKEAENVCTLLSLTRKLNVHSLITGAEATISKLLSMDGPYVLHIATHGYSGKQISHAYRGNFWTDTSSGILLAGAKTFQQKRFEVMDPKMGSGYMNALAACGMQLRGTRLVFISACNSSVGPRPSQEMPTSFMQALRAAGADTAISTLWTISDNESVDFVSYFYDYLISRPSSRPSEALSYAKSTMKGAGKSMFYWGAFVCHGIDKPLFAD